MPQLGSRAPLVSALALSLMLCGAAAGQVSIRLVGVPETLRLPVPPGTNAVVTAQISGGNVESVWLAPAKPAGPSSRVPLAKVGEGEYQINLGESAVFELLKDQGEEGEFSVFAKATGGATAQSVTVRFSAPAVPERFEFPWQEAKITLFQRSLTDLPGRTGALQVQLGDIGGGHVLVSVFGPRNEVLVDLIRMRVGGAVFVTLEDNRYVLRVDELFTAGTARDYGTFTLMPVHAWEGQRISRLLAMIEESNITLIRDGQYANSSFFASLLRHERDQYGAKGPTLTRFIEEAATNNPSSGEPYRIQMPNGAESEAGPWLHRLAQEIPTATRP